MISSFSFEFLKVSKGTEFLTLTERDCKFLKIGMYSKGKFPAC